MSNELKVEQRINKSFLDPGGAGAASLSVESADAADGSLASVAPAGVEPRDVAPVWIGDGSMPAHTYSGDDNAGPAIGGVATDEGQLTGGNQMQMAPSISGEGDLSQ